MGASAKKKSMGDAKTENSSDFLSLEGGAARNFPKTEKKQDAGFKSTVLYIGRIPHGFYEKEMEGFFKQFGTVKRVKISRNRKTGKSKHYGFIEFESPEVAEVVEECMHNYLVYEKLLQVHRIPPEQVHPRLWRGLNRTKEPKDWVAIQRYRQQKSKTPEQQQKLVDGILRRDRARRKRIEAAGIEYECPTFAGLDNNYPCAPKKIKFDEEGLPLSSS